MSTGHLIFDAFVVGRFIATSSAVRAHTSFRHVGPAIASYPSRAPGVVMIATDPGFPASGMWCGADPVMAVAASATRVPLASAARAVRRIDRFAGPRPIHRLPEPARPPPRSGDLRPLRPARGHPSKRCPTQRFGRGRPLATGARHRLRPDSPGAACDRRRSGAGSRRTRQRSDNRIRRIDPRSGEADGKVHQRGITRTAEPVRDHDARP